MVGGAWSGRPVETPVCRADRHIVNAGFAPAHQTVFVKLPLLVAVGPKPVDGVVMPLVLESNGDSVVMESPKLFDQPVIELSGPLAAKKLDDRLAPGKKLGAIAPAAVFRVGKRDSLGLASIPRIFRDADFWRAVSSVKGGNGGRVVMRRECHIPVQIPV